MVSSYSTHDSSHVLSYTHHLHRFWPLRCRSISVNLTLSTWSVESGRLWPFEKLWWYLSRSIDQNCHAPLQLNIPTNFQIGQFFDNICRKDYNSELCRANKIVPPAHEAWPPSDPFEVPHCRWRSTREPKRHHETNHDHYGSRHIADPGGLKLPLWTCDLGFVQIASSSQGYWWRVRADSGHVRSARDFRRRLRHRPPIQWIEYFGNIPGGTKYIMTSTLDFWDDDWLILYPVLLLLGWQLAGLVLFPPIGNKTSDGCQITWWWLLLNSNSISDPK